MANTPHNALTLRHAARLALQLAHSSNPTSPNPQVGCVILDGASRLISFGRHEGAGSAHAEAAALAAAGAGAQRLLEATAVVTLEPCSKHGRTPPCTDALIAAGVGRVIYLVDDPTGFGGGAQKLRAAGVEVWGPKELREGTALSAGAGARFGGGAHAEGAGADDWGVEIELADRLLVPWITAAKQERPYVVAKFATTIDGRIAAADGSSQWITSNAAREHVHRVRAEVDGIIVGTGTVLADDPSLTVRLKSLGDCGAPGPGASELGGQPLGDEFQPRRIVIGLRKIPANAKLRGPGGELLHIKTHDVHEALNTMFSKGLRHVVVEGGAQILSQFLRAGVVDEIHHYLAPALLGAGAPVVQDFGITNISQASRWARRHLMDLQPDLLQVLTHQDRALASAVPGTWLEEQPQFDHLQKQCKEEA